MRLSFLVVVPLVVGLTTAPLPRAALAAEVTDPAIVRRAEAIATEAKLLFQQKLFGPAAERFMEAYTLVRRPTLIYNAARAYEQAGQSSKAAALFRAYRDLPGAPADGRADADTRIARLDAEATAQSQELKAKEAELRALEAARQAKDAAERRAREVPLPNAATPTVVAQRQPQPPLVQQDATSPLVPTVTAGGLALLSGVLFVLAKGQEAKARDIEDAGFQTAARRDAYLDHASNAQWLQGGAIAGSVLTVGALGWLAWDLYRGQGAEPGPGASPRTTWRWAPAVDGASLGVAVLF